MSELTSNQQKVVDLYVEHGSKREVARQLGISPTAVRKTIKRVENKGGAPWLSPAPQPEHLAMVKTTVQYDSDGRVKNEWRRSVPELQELDELADAICERVEGKGRASKRRPRKSDTQDRLFEIDIYDPHIGMYAAAKETGDQDYTTELAAERMIKAVEDLAGRAGRPHKLVLVLGGDIQHSDNRSNRTEKSDNALDVDSRYYRVVNYVAEACTTCVDICSQVAAEVQIVVLPGNHDWHSCVWLQRLLSSLYSRTPNVSVLDQHTPRKRLVWGNNLLAWAHGDGIAASKWGQVIAAEMAQDWGATTFRHLKLGHIHHKKAVAPVVVDEQAGLLVEYLEALCPSDAWHSNSGFVGSAKGASAFEYDKKAGLYTRHFHHPTT